jgi:PA14 domain
LSFEAFAADEGVRRGPSIASEKAEPPRADSRGRPQFQFNNWSVSYQGTYTPPATGEYNFSVVESGTTKLYINGKLADVAVVFAGREDGEGHDIESLSPPGDQNQASPNQGPGATAAEYPGLTDPATCTTPPPPASRPSSCARSRR